MKIFSTYVITFAMLFAFFCVYTVPVFAAGTVQDGSIGFSIENPLAVKSICGLIQKLLSLFLSIGMPVAAVFLAWAGFKFVMARGNPGELGKAKTNLWYVFVGVFIFLASWLLGQVIANTIRTIAPQTSTTSGGSCN